MRSAAAQPALASTRLVTLRALWASAARTLAFALTGLILFIVANSFPFLSFEMQGQRTETTLFSGVADLTAQGKAEVAAVVFFTAILAPGLQLLLLLIVLAPLKLGRRRPWTRISSGSGCHCRSGCGGHRDGVKGSSAAMCASWCYRSRRPFAIKVRSFVSKPS
ncbi:MAG: paraquat-inducible protein A [Lamprobacter sp.]|uniref:paraquat-inducible protein A n=1 Tax=Lamprobacter sp. TaxID=3100796 RepID=UPI002B263BE3|nr:paraquat-inducible protein A [Lamprobacter sp.]MEA3639473.1 paraquat-inducible protein A [Lamprobacter sp.]